MEFFQKVSLLLVVENNLIFVPECYCDQMTY